MRASSESRGSRPARHACRRHLGDEKQRRRAGSTAAAPAISPSRVRKTTTPVPSLKRLSPAMRVSRLLGTPTRFRTARTATGSVGEMSAPNSRQCSSEMPRPSVRVATKKRRPRSPSRARRQTSRARGSATFPVRCRRCRCAGCRQRAATRARHGAAAPGSRCGRPSP